MDRRTLKESFQFAGWVALILGIMCLPAGWEGLGGASKRDQSVFYTVADMGAFLKFAAVGIGTGMILLVIAALFPKS